jgi:hypothetical protein
MEVTNMEKAKHTPEPWRYDGIPWKEGENIYGTFDIHAENKKWIGDTKPYGGENFTGIEEAEANAQRIVQCVNACKGIENPGETIVELAEACDFLLSEITKNGIKPELVDKLTFIAQMISKLEGVK